MFADVLGIPIRVSECKETGALGAALCAGVGVGVWKNLSEAAQQAVQLTPDLFLPRPDRHQFHSTRYKIFKKLERVMSEMWQEAS
ncbi:FGGY-family carbohydrate kinase [Pantoea sp. LMR881]|nr:FGGY-family carbohydrate kinase [Pantoea sp. LMR881]MCZ4058407.1 FGGY-family carbohydrate kinase [Pantoea sp. LMR881]